MPLGFDDPQAVGSSDASPGARWQEAQGGSFATPVGDSNWWHALPTGAIFALGGFVALAAMVVLSSGSLHLQLAAVALITGAALAWMVWQTVIDPRWLALALVLAETLPYTNLIPIDPHSRWFLRYPLLFAFCLPALPRVWKSGILTKGHLPLFLAYFGWAAITIVYSEDPVASAGRLFPAFLLFLTIVLVASMVSDAKDVTAIFTRYFLGCSVLAGLAFATAVFFPMNVLGIGQGSNEDVPAGVYNWMADDSGINRFTGYSYTPNEIGALMLVTVGIGLVLWPRYRGWKRTSIAFVMIATMVFAAMADSRSTFVSIVVGISAYVVWKFRARGLLVLSALALMGLVGYEIYGLGTGAAFNRDVTTLTGRTEAWQFEVVKMLERPLTGYGYAVEGAIFKDRRFPNWETFWDNGPNSPLHNSYMSLAIGLGLPATFLFLYLVLAPWVAVFRRKDDPLGLKQIFFFIVVPALVLGIVESEMSEARGVRGLIFFIAWALAECQRIESREKRKHEAEQSRSSTWLTVGSKIAVLGIGILLAGVSHASAADYYVNVQNGNDGNPGTSTSAPWRSLAKVDGFPFQPGDVVYLARGSVWRETLRPDRGNFARVTFTAYGSGDLPTIKGSDVVSQWSPVSGGVYSAPESKPVFNVFVDGRPGWGLLHACCPAGGSCEPTNPKAFSRGQTCKVGPMQPGSWYWSGGTLYVWPAGGSELSGHTVEAVTRQYGVQGYASRGDLDGLVLDHIEVRQAGIRGISLQSSDAAGCCGSRGIGGGAGIRDLVIRDCAVSETGTGQIDDGSYGSAVVVLNATAPLIEGNLVSYAGNHGNDLNIQNSNGAHIVGNRVDHWNHNGIDIKGSRDVVVENNISRDQPSVGSGFYTEFSQNVLFRNNQAIDVSNGFQVSVGAAATIEDNRITDAGTVIYFGPRSLSLKADGNTASGFRALIGRDGSGHLLQANNSWGR